MEVVLQEAPLDEARARAAVADPSLGAILVFHGVVRSHHAGRAVQRIDYQSYRPMAEAELRRVAEEVSKRHGIDRVAIFHRLGVVQVGEASLLVAVAARHRAPTFACALEIIDEIKRRVPIWKKEFGPDGAFWVKGILPGDDAAPRGGSGD